MKKEMSSKRVILITILLITFAVFLAIMIKSFLPAEVNVEDFDSVLVRLLGFPLVAILYFFIVYAHSIIVMQYFGKQASVSKYQIGVRFGMVFAAMYFFGMQEVVVEASPFDEWGLPFVRYQFIIGITDALPVLMLCLVASSILFSGKGTYVSMNNLKRRDKIKIVSLVTFTFILQRLIGYETGLIDSNVARFPLPAYLWTGLFGVILGTSYVLLYPLFNKSKGVLKISFQIAVLTIGLNWILFNSFIGMIFEGVMGQMLLRTGIDVAVLFITAICFHSYQRNRERSHYVANA